MFGVIAGKVYPRIKYLIVVLIVVGVVLFFYKDDGDSNGDHQSKFMHMVGFGEFLIVSTLHVCHSPSPGLLWCECLGGLLHGQTMTACWLCGVFMPPHCRMDNSVELLF